MRVLALTLIGLLAIASSAEAQMEELSPFDFEDDADAPGEGEGEAEAPLLEEFEVDARDAVLSAARTKTTIQEAPGIITVVTAAEIEARGHRTLNDVLRTVPGFEGDRLESNGWFNESIARGQPRTLLILLNGVNITEPVRNTLSIDRKIPLASIKRIEVTSGPGGVLWGSNALLGVVNIILKDHTDVDGVEIAAGGGHGPGAMAAFGARAAIGESFFDGQVELYTAVDFYSDRGAELQVGERKVLGALPQPEFDSKTIYDPADGVTDFNSRDWWLAHTLVLRVFDTLTVDWQLQFETDHRQLATGGALLEGSRLDPETGALDPVYVETIGKDPLQVVGLNWRDRFAGDTLGLSARVYGVRFQVSEQPFWAFPPRYVPGVDALADGVSIGLEVDHQVRYGLNLDADVSLDDHTVVFGFEAFQERLVEAWRQDTLRKRIHLPRVGARDPTSREIPESAIFGPDRCPLAGRRTVAIDGQLTDDVIFLDDNCRFEERFLDDATRTVGAFYVSDEWRLARSLTLQPGFRAQYYTERYGLVPLFSGALVWNIVDKLYLKLNYAEGFRPPSFDSTEIKELAISTLSYQSNEDIDVETSRAGEMELNAVLFENKGPLRRMYVRADYAYTVLSDVIRNVGGQFANSGEREIHSAEVFTRVEFDGDHELWFGGHFIKAEDSVFGPVRNFPELAFTGGARVRVVGPLELSGLAMWYGAQEDFNRPPGAVEFPAGSGYLQSDASDVAVEYIEPSLTLRFGARLVELFDERVDFSVFVYNALDERRQDPDFFFDDRVISRPQPRPGWSWFAQARARLF